MAEHNNTEDVEGRIHLQFIHPESWVQLRHHCATYGVSIEYEDRDDLILTISREEFERLPLSIRQQFRLFTMQEGAKRINAYRNRPIRMPRQRMPEIRQTAEDEKIVRQLIPEHLLARE